MTSYESFRNPDRIYRGTDFWMLNGKLTDEEMIRQLDEMHKQGVQCVIARTYIGLESDYPGEGFKARIRTACEHARRLGMQIFLQAGYMPEHVLDLPLAYSLDYIRITKTEDAPRNEEVLHRADGYTYTRYPSGTFLDLFNEDAVAFYLLQSYERMWAGFEEFFGTTVPSVWVDEPSYGGEYLPLPRGFLERFKEKWGYDLAPRLDCLYFDHEGYETVRYHYRKLLEERLEVCYFAMMREWCNSHGLMASGHLMGEDTMETQIDRACAVMPYYRYFDIPGMDILKGQMNFRHNPLHGQVDPLHAHINTEYRPLVTTTPLQLTSVARQTGAEHILCEMYAVSTQNMTFRHQKHMFDYMAMYGINHRSVHGIFYSLHGRSKRAYPPQLNYYQPYFKDLHIMYDYVASVSRFVSIGEPDGDVLVIHPQGSAYCEYVNRVYDRLTGRQPSGNALRRRDAAFHDLITDLLLANVVFDLGDERIMEALGSVADGALTVGKMRYQTVVLPSLLTVASSTVALLRAFSEAGGRVIVMGDVPRYVDGYPATDALAGVRYITARDVTDVEHLTANKTFSFRSEFFDKTVYIRRRTEAGCGYFFLFNPDCSAAVDGVLSLAGTYTAELWDGFTQERTHVSVSHEKGETHMHLTIPEGGSLMLVATPAEDLGAHPLAGAPVTVNIPLSSEWRLAHRDTPNVLLLEFCDYKRGDDAYTGKELPVLALDQILTHEGYHGPLTQKFVFTAAEAFGGVSLALENAEAHEIFLNGKRISPVREGYYLAKDFERVRIGDIARGVNVLEIKREYAPLTKMLSGIGSLFQTRTGCELESVYLLGDFAVLASTEPVRNGDLRFARRMLLAPEKKSVCGELTREGYPFYAGDITLSKTFTFAGTTHKNANVYLHLDELNACTAHVRLNGKDCGVIHTAPYRCAIGDALQAGENLLEITLVNTLRNLLGPYHNPKGEVGNLFGGGYVNQNAAWVGGAADDFTWFEKRVPDTDVWTDSYMQTPLNIKAAKIQIVQK